MKRIYVAAIATILFFAACENGSSSTVGTYENEEISSSANEKEDTIKEQHLSNETGNVRDLSIDSAKNIPGTSKDSAASNHP